MTAQQTKQLWCSLVDEKFKDKANYYQAIAEKLKRLKFGYGDTLNGWPGKVKPKHGKHRNGVIEDMHCPLCYVRKHFGRSLLREFAIKLQSREIPKRKNRTRVEPFSPKRDQMALFKANQLKLF